MKTWTLKGLHLLERNPLVFIIALGESILLLGGTLVGPLFLTATIGFAMIVAMWWLCFVHPGAAVADALHSAEEQTKEARAGLAYAHGIMVGGAIVVAVAIEVIVAHPTDAVSLSSTLIACAGPMIFMLGNILFRSTLRRSIPWSFGVPFVAMPLGGGMGHAFLARGNVLGLAMLAIVVAVVLVTPDRGASKEIAA